MNELAQGQISAYDELWYLPKNQVSYISINDYIYLLSESWIQSLDEWNYLPDNIIENILDFSAINFTLANSNCPIEGEIYDNEYIYYDNVHAMYWIVDSSYWSIERFQEMVYNLSC